MSIISYTGRTVTVMVGAVNISQYLVNLTVAWPPYEPGQPATAQGQLELDLGSADLDLFDLFQRPDLWRPGQAQVRVSVDGNLLPIFRIDRYSYDKQQLSATATIVQVLDLVRGEPAEPPAIPTDDINKTPHVNSLSANALDYFAGTYGFKLAEVSKRLIDNEFVNTPVDGDITTDFTLFTDDDTADRPIQYVDGVAQVDQFAGAVFGALTVNTNEDVILVDIDPTNKTALFDRPASAVEMEEDLANVDFWSPTAYLETERYTQSSFGRFIFRENREDDELDNVTPDGRFYFQLTEEEKAHDEIFEVEDGQPGDEIFAAEKKTIFYQYVDRDFRVTGTTLEARTALLTPAVQLLLEPFPNKEDDEIVYQVVTVKEWPKRRIDPTNDDFSKTEFTAAEVIVEGPKLKAVFKPKNVLDKDSPTDFSLALASKEVLTTRAPAVIEPEVIKDDEDNKYVAQSRIPLIPRLPLPDYPLTLTTIVSTYTLPAESPSWVPFSPKPLIINYDFVTSQEGADRLVELMAKRELSRRDSKQLTLPIPTEWLEAGCPMAPVVNLGDAKYQLDGITLSLGQEEAVMTCSALYLSKLLNPVPEPTATITIPTGTV